MSSVGTLGVRSREDDAGRKLNEYIEKCGKDGLTKMTIPPEQRYKSAAVFLRDFATQPANKALAKQYYQIQETLATNAATKAEKAAAKAAAPAAPAAKAAAPVAASMQTPSQEYTEQLKLQFPNIVQNFIAQVIDMEIRTSMEDGEAFGRLIKAGLKEERKETTANYLQDYAEPMYISTALIYLLAEKAQTESDLGALEVILGKVERLQSGVNTNIYANEHTSIKKRIEEVRAAAGAAGAGATGVGAEPEPEPAAQAAQAQAALAQAGAKAMEAVRLDTEGNEVRAATLYRVVVELLRNIDAEKFSKKISEYTKRADELVPLILGATIVEAGPASAPPDHIQVLKDYFTTINLSKDTNQLMDIIGHVRSLVDQTEYGPQFTTLARDVAERARLKLEQLQDASRLQATAGASGGVGGGRTRRTRTKRSSRRKKKRTKRVRRSRRKTRRTHKRSRKTKRVKSRVRSRMRRTYRR